MLRPNAAASGRVFSTMLLACPGCGIRRHVPLGTAPRLLCAACGLPDSATPEVLPPAAAPAIPSPADAAAQRLRDYENVLAWDRLNTVMLSLVVILAWVVIGAWRRLSSTDLWMSFVVFVVPFFAAAETLVFLARRSAVPDLHVQRSTCYGLVLVQLVLYLTAWAVFIHTEGDCSRPALMMAIGPFLLQTTTRVFLPMERLSALIASLMVHFVFLIVGILLPFVGAMMTGVWR